MRKIFKPKQYQNKARVQTSIQAGISKCWTWDIEISEYRFSSYEARKMNRADGELKEVKQHFSDLNQAKLWRIGELVKTSFSTILFKELAALWIKNEVEHMSRPSQVFYTNRLHYLDYFNNFHVEEITFLKVEEWINYLKNNKVTVKRFSFEKEVKMLKQILNYYMKINLDYSRNPVGTDQIKKARVKFGPKKDKELSEADFIKFRDELSKMKDGNRLAVFASIHFYHALRACEVAALSWNDIHFSEVIKNNRIIFSKSVKWTRSKKFGTYIDQGLKNSKDANDDKNQIIEPAINNLLLNYKCACSNKNGLLFPKLELAQEPLEYRYIQYYYNAAFKKAGINFTSTHVLRHGGNRHDLNTHGDITIAQVKLGNKSMSSTEVYSKRDSRLLDAFTIKKYESYEKE